MRIPKTYRQNNNRGVAIVIALFFAFIMMILFLAMMSRQANTAGHNKLSIQERQAYFAARAAMQHFLLKAKLFPTELYDSVEFMQGKNPLCSFAEFGGTTKSGKNAFEPMKSNSNLYVRVHPARELDMKKQPKYFYFAIPGKDAFIRVGSYYNPDFRYLMPGLAVSEPALKYLNPTPPPSSMNADKFLQYYIRDCTNMRVKNAIVQPGLEIKGSKNIKNIQHWDAAESDGYPYSMGYKVVDIKLQAMKELRKYGEEAIEIMVEGQAKDFQGKITKQVQRKVQKITRRGAL